MTVEIKWSNLIATCNGTTTTLIDWTSLLQSSEKDSWPLTEDMSGLIVNLEQFAQNFLSHTVLINQWSEKRIRAMKDLCKSLYFPAEMPPSRLPQLYFEMEGSDSLFYIEFSPSTEDILCGQYKMSLDEIKIVLPTLNEQDHTSGLLVNIRKIDETIIDEIGDQNLVHARNQLYSHIICFGEKWQVMPLTGIF
jgi:hypothetical protein